MLKVIGKGEDYKRRNRTETTWICECQCSDKNIVTLRQYRLLNGYAKSCGCKSKEKRFKRKSNNYDLSHNYGIGYIGENDKFYFDLEDYDKIKDYCWYKNHDGYIIHGGNGKEYFLLHRLVSDCDETHDVDHINHNKSDNRKINLRIVTTQQNCMNQKLSKNNSSGCSGVHKCRNKWVSTIGYKNEVIRLGSFNDYEDAVKARKNAERELYGQYSYDNSMKFGKDIELK